MICLTARARTSSQRRDDHRQGDDDGEESLAGKRLSRIIAPETDADTDRLGQIEPGAPADWARRGDDRRGGGAPGRVGRRGHGQ